MSVSSKPKPGRPDPDAQIWSSLLTHMRAHRPDICRQWFDQLEPLGVSGGVLRVRAHSVIHRDYLQKTCLGPFNDAAQSATGHLISVRFYGLEEPVEVVLKDQNPPAGVTIPAKALNESAPDQSARSQNLNHADNRVGTQRSSTDDPPVIHTPSTRGGSESGTGMREFIPTPSAARETGERIYDDGLVLNPDYAFDNFVTGLNNRLAHAAALAVSASPGRSYNPLFIHGGVGLGKTHLLQAICLAVRAQNPAAVIYYTSCDDFTTQFHQAVAANAMHNFRHKFRHVDVLVVDDIHFLSRKEKTQEEFFHTFNALHQNNKQVVLSSDAPPSEIPELEDRLISRFKMGLVAEVTPPDFETRVQILKNKSRLRGFELTEPVAQRIAQRIDSNIRELEGAVVKLQMMATIEKRPIDLDLVKQALGEPEIGEEATVQIPTIIEAVSEFYGIKMVDMQSKRRQRSVAMPRQVCMYLARHNTRFSLEEIGGYFGGRDHTTVMHAVKIVDIRCKKDPEFAQQVQALETKLRGSRT